MMAVRHPHSKRFVCPIQYNLTLTTWWLNPATVLRVPYPMEVLSPHELLAQP